MRLQSLLHLLSIFPPLLLRMRSRGPSYQGQRDSRGSVSRRKTAGHSTERCKKMMKKTRDVLLQVFAVFLECGGQICRSSAWFHRKTIEKQCSWVLMFCGSMYESRAQESVLLWPWIRRKNDPQWNEIHKQWFHSFCQSLICYLNIFFSLFVIKLELTNE